MPARRTAGADGRRAPCETVICGNIGAAARLDFTVIGPAVNLVSPVETVVKALDLPIVVSEAFARAYGGNLRSLGDVGEKYFVDAALRSLSIEGSLGACVHRKTGRKISLR